MEEWKRKNNNGNYCIVRIILIIQKKSGKDKKRIRVTRTNGKLITKREILIQIK